MRLTWVFLAMVSVFSGCLLDSGKGNIGLIGSWTYAFEGSPIDARLPYTNIYTFADSGQVRFDFIVMGMSFGGYLGTWVLRQDTLIMQPRVCFNPPDSAGMLELLPCSETQPKEDRLYWDGTRMYGWGANVDMHQNYRKARPPRQSGPPKRYR